MRFNTFLCLALAAYSAWITISWWPGPPEFTDLLARQPSPDGAIVAAYVVQNHGPMTGTTYGLTLSARQGNPLKAPPILVFGEDDSDPQFTWINDMRLEVRLPCGWWGYLTNHYQLIGTSRIIDIAYLPPDPQCAQHHPRTSALPG